MPANAAPPVRTAPGRLLPAAWESKPARPLTIPAATTMTRSQAHRDDGGDTVDVLPDFSVITTAQEPESTRRWLQHESANLTHAREFHSPAKDQRMHW